MSSDADRLWNEIVPQYRKRKHLRPMSPDEAEAAFDEAPSIPVSDDEIRRIVGDITSGRRLNARPAHQDWHDVEQGEIAEEMLALYREQGQPDPESEEIEEELRKRLLENESDGEDGMAGGPKTPRESR